MVGISWDSDQDGSFRPRKGNSLNDKEGDGPEKGGRVRWSEVSDKRPSDEFQSPEPEVS